MWVSYLCASLICIGKWWCRQCWDQWFKCYWEILFLSVFHFCLLVSALHILLPESSLWSMSPPPCSVSQRNDKRERWLITLVTLLMFWPWATSPGRVTITYPTPPPRAELWTASVNAEVNGACPGDVWNKLLLARKDTSAHNISLKSSVLPLVHVEAIYHFFLAVNNWWACNMQWLRSRND